MRKNRFGKALVAVFAFAIVTIMTAQTVIKCPQYCDPVWLEQEYGAGWHAYYFLFGCFLISPPCGQIDNNLAGLPKEALARPALVMRGGR